MVGRGGVGRAGRGSGGDPVWHIERVGEMVGWGGAGQGEVEIWLGGAGLRRMKVGCASSMGGNEKTLIWQREDTATQHSISSCSTASLHATDTVNLLARVRLLRHYLTMALLTMALLTMALFTWHYLLLALLTHLLARVGLLRHYLTMALLTMALLTMALLICHYLLLALLTHLLARVGLLRQRSVAVSALCCRHTLVFKVLRHRPHRRLRLAHRHRFQRQDRKLCCRFALPALVPAKVEGQARPLRHNIMDCRIRSDPIRYSPSQSPVPAISTPLTDFLARALRRSFLRNLVEQTSNPAPLRWEWWDVKPYDTLLPTRAYGLLAYGC